MELVNLEIYIAVSNIRYEGEELYGYFGTSDVVIQVRAKILEKIDPLWPFLT